MATGTRSARCMASSRRSRAGSGRAGAAATASTTSLFQRRSRSEPATTRTTGGARGCRTTRRLSRRSVLERPQAAGEAAQVGGAVGGDVDAGVVVVPLAGAAGQVLVGRLARAQVAAGPVAGDGPRGRPPVGGP